MNDQEGLPQLESMLIGKKVAIQAKLMSLAGIDVNNPQVRNWIESYSSTFENYTKFHPEISVMWDDESKRDEVLRILIEADGYGYQDHAEAA
jgi:hypothetical protein